MSTEARRASIPPRPSVPPRPAAPPGEPSSAPDRTPPPAPATAPSRPGGRDRVDVPPPPQRPPTAGRGISSPATSSFAPAASAPASGLSGRPDASGAPASYGAGSASRTGSTGAAGTPAPAPEAAPDPAARRTPASSRFPNLRLDRTTERTAGRIAPPAEPPPPPPSARFPDLPPGAGAPMARTTTAPERTTGPDTIPPQRTAPFAEGIVETTARLRIVRPERDATPPAAPPAPATRPFVTFAEPDTRGVGGPGTHGVATTARRPFAARLSSRATAAAVCLVLGLGLLGGAATGSWLTGDGTDDSAHNAFTVTGSLWHSVPVDRLLPPVVQGPGAGPGGADRTWTRIAVAPDSDCRYAFDPLLGKALAPLGCLRLLRATYTDATRSHVTTVGLLFTRADAAATSAAGRRFKSQHLDSRTDLMPRPYAAKGTVAQGFGDAQRASWTISVLTDLPVVVYAVSGFADGRTVTDPQPAAAAMANGATTAPAQAGLGNEATGLADPVQSALRKTVTSVTGEPS
ncbi:hypothetical protein ABZ845_28640 [Streptomyces sp. NPDC047022]|uniref:hypothetical protein n=1 Tax=Streptomyces sp. NPDC047022 TaxID=3155737 RepID=UPI00340FFEAB